VRAVLLALFALVVFIEERGWRPLAASLGRFARWPPIARLEALIRRPPPRLALAPFLMPAILLAPVKIGAFWLIEQGRARLGIALIVLAKGARHGARRPALFILVASQLMALAWYARCVARWAATRDRVMAALRQSIARRSARVTRRVWREAVRRLAA
jgi:hypothetical protein